MVIDGNLSLGTFTAFISYVSLFFSPISQLSTLWTSYKSALPSFDRIKELFDMKSDNNGSNELKITNGEIKLEPEGCDTQVGEDGMSLQWGKTKNSHWPGQF